MKANPTRSALEAVEKAMMPKAAAQGPGQRSGALQSVESCRLPGEARGGTPYARWVCHLANQ